MEELKNVEYNDLEDMVIRMELTYSEIEIRLKKNYFDGSTVRYTLEPSFYEISDVNLMRKSLLPDEVKPIHTIDDIRLRSNLTTSKTIRFTKKSIFLYYIRIHSISFWNIKWFWRFPSIDIR